jgi:hypothetical protein
MKTRENCLRSVESLDRRRADTKRSDQSQLKAPSYTYPCMPRYKRPLMAIYRSVHVSHTNQGSLPTSYKDKEVRMRQRKASASVPAAGAFEAYSTRWRTRQTGQAV